MCGVQTYRYLLNDGVENLNKMEEWKGSDGHRLLHTKTLISSPNTAWSIRNVRAGFSKTLSIGPAPLPLKLLEKLQLTSQRWVLLDIPPLVPWKAWEIRLLFLKISFHTPHSWASEQIVSIGSHFHSSEMHLLMGIIWASPRDGQVEWLPWAPTSKGMLYIPLYHSAFYSSLLLFFQLFSHAV